MALIINKMINNPAITNDHVDQKYHPIKLAIIRISDGIRNVDENLLVACQYGLY